MYIYYILSKLLSFNCNIVIDIIRVPVSDGGKLELSHFRFLVGINRNLY